MPPLPGASLADWSSAWRVGKFSDSKTLVSYALQCPDGLKMPPAVNFGGSVVAGIGWPGLKKPTGSHGSLLMSSGGCGAKGAGGGGRPRARGRGGGRAGGYEEEGGEGGERRDPESHVPDNAADRSNLRCRFFSAAQHGP